MDGSRPGVFAPKAWRMTLKDYQELQIGIAVRLLPGVFVSTDNECTTNAGQGKLPFCFCIN